tara:strand:- start:941 stop:1414 length:474 start_codon:yes stop_codon:yes gene_type:complete
MGFLKKIRNNILNQQNSFHIGFGNRSPFSYKGKYSGDWTPEVPNLVITKPVSQTPVLDAEINLVGKVADATAKIAKAAIEHKVDDPNKKSKRLKRRYDRISDRSLRAYDKDTKRGDRRGDRRYDKAEDIAAKASRAKVQEDCVLKQGTYDPETNTCS